MGGLGCDWVGVVCRLGLGVCWGDGRIKIYNIFFYIFLSVFNFWSFVYIFIFFIITGNQHTTNLAVQGQLLPYGTAAGIPWDSPTCCDAWDGKSKKKKKKMSGIASREAF